MPWAIAAAGAASAAGAAAGSSGGANASPEEDWAGAVALYGLEEATKRYPYQAKTFGTAQQNADLQLELLQKQSTATDEAYKQNQLLQPLLLQQAGIVAQRDEAGNITGYELAPQSEEDRLLEELSLTGLRGQVDYQTMQNDLLKQQLSSFQTNEPLRAQTEKATLERTLAALEGKLPVDPSLIDELDQAERQLEERFASQLGPGYQTSSPYIEAKNDFIRTKEQALEGARRGEITSLGQLGFSMGNASAANAYGAPQTGLAGFAANQDATQRLLGNTSSLMSQPLNFSGAYGQVAQGYQMPIGNFQFGQQLQQNREASSEAANAAVWSDIFSGAGQIGGMYLGSKLWK